MSLASAGGIAFFVPAVLFTKADNRQANFLLGRRRK